MALTDGPGTRLEARWPVAAPRAFWRPSRWSLSPSRSTPSSRTRASRPAATPASPATHDRDADARPRSRKKKSTKKRKTYTVKAGDTPSGIAEKTGISLETLTSSTPTSTRRPSPGPEDQADRVRRTGARRRRGGAPRSAAPRPRRRREPPACPTRSARRARSSSRSRPASSPARAPADKRLLDRLDDEADDRAAHARGGEAQRHVHGRRLQRAAGRVQDRPAAGRADEGLRPDARPAAGVRQRRRGHARRGRVRLAQGVRARDEPPRARSSASSNTHFANPIGLDQEGNYSSRARPGDAGHACCATNPFFKKVVDSPVGHAQDRRPPAHVPQPQPARRPLPVRQRRQDRPHPRRRLRARRLGAAATASSSSAPSLGTPSEAARDSDTMDLFNWAFPRFQRIRAGDRGPADGHGADPLPPGRRAQARPGPHGAPDRPARPPRRGQDRRPRAGGRRRPDPPRPAARARRGHARAGSSSPPSPLVAEGAVPAAEIAQKTKSAAGRPWVLSASRSPHLSLRSCSHAAAPRPRGGLGEATRRMIVTVTLNTAIDKTLSVPNFRLGRRHRTVEQTTMPGGKGVNVARVLKTLGAPVIATGLAGGATGTRIVDQLTQLVRAQRLRPDRRGVAHEHGRDRPDDRRADRDQRARARRSRRARSSCSSTSCSTWPRARSCACSPARSRARWTPTSTRFLIRELRQARTSRP